MSGLFSQPQQDVPSEVVDLLDLVRKGGITNMVADYREVMQIAKNIADIKPEYSEALRWLKEDRIAHYSAALSALGKRYSAEQ